MHLQSHPSLALIELGSIARGHVVGDAMVKKAPVEVLAAGPVTPGKYLILVGGGEAEVEEAWQAGLECSGGHLIDSLLLPGVHKALPPAVAGHVEEAQAEGSWTLVETDTVASALSAADACLKGAEVHLMELRLAMGIGGRGVFRLDGALDQAQAAAEIAREQAREHLVQVEVIPQPDPGYSGGLRWVAGGATWK